MTYALNYALAIIANTPWWVWLILIVVTTLGLRGLRPGRLSPIGMSILPLVSLVLAVLGLVRFSPPLPALSAWFLATVVGAALGVARASRREMALVDGEIQVSGSWFALGLGLAIFTVQYAQGVLNAIIPGLRADPLWLAASFGFSGFTLGLGMGWLVRMHQRVRACAACGPLRSQVAASAIPANAIAPPTSRRPTVPDSRRASRPMPMPATCSAMVAATKPTP
jgi:hypothetical protein